MHLRKDDPLILFLINMTYLVSLHQRYDVNRSIFRSLSDYLGINHYLDFQTGRLFSLGMCTYGFAARAILRVACAYDPRRLKGFGARISSPVYPGDLLRTEIWQDGDVVSFRTTIPARDNVVVINNGRADVVAGA